MGNKLKIYENNLKECFERIDNNSFVCQKKVLNAFIKNNVATRHFHGTTGYGYDDIGRDTLAKVYADVFNAESAIVSPLIACGSHAIAISLFGILRPNDIMLSVSGNPYDTLEETINGRVGMDIGSLKDFGIVYKQIDLLNNELNFDEIKQQIKKLQPKIVYMQRSRGYQWRSPLKIEDFEKVSKIIKQFSPNSYLVVDNCYGEFVSEKEPTDVGADVVVGSLIKNLGGGVAQSGGYIVGTKKAIDLISSRFLSPSLGLEVGSYEQGYRNFYQGLFLAPHVVAQSIKGALLVGEIMQSLGYEVFPSKNDFIGDIILSIKFNSKEELIKFVQLVQSVSPVESFVVPEPWSMPGYQDDVIMAAGTFVSGASIELSCDAPIKTPYIGYLQGGLTFEHVKCFAEKLIENFQRS